MVRAKVIFCCILLVETSALETITSIKNWSSWNVHHRRKWPRQTNHGRFSTLKHGTGRFVNKKKKKSANKKIVISDAIGLLRKIMRPTNRKVGELMFFHVDVTWNASASFPPIQLLLVFKIKSLPIIHELPLRKKLCRKMCRGHFCSTGRLFTNRISVDYQFNRSQQVDLMSYVTL